MCACSTVTHAHTLPRGHGPRTPDRNTDLRYGSNKRHYAASDRIVSIAHARNPITSSAHAFHPINRVPRAISLMRNQPGGGGSRTRTETLFVRIVLFLIQGFCPFLRRTHHGQIQGPSYLGRDPGVHSFGRCQTVHWRTFQDLFLVDSSLLPGFGSVAKSDSPSSCFSHFGGDSHCENHELRS